MSDGKAEHTAATDVQGGLPLGDGEKACRQCGHPMPSAAPLCSTCNSYQDWRGFIPITSSTLAVLTALLSVASVVVPSAFRAWHRPVSEAYLTMPSFDGATLHVIAVNKGDAPALLMPAKVKSELLPGATKVRLRDDHSAYIAPGTQQITFDIVPPFSGDQAYAASLKALDPIAKSAIATFKGRPPKDADSLSAGTVLIGVMQSSGEYTVQGIPIISEDMYHLLRADADRCEAEKSPNFENGCIGNGAPD